MTISALSKSSSLSVLTTLTDTFRYRKIDLKRIAGYTPTIQDTTTCSAANILDQEAIRNKFNYSFSLPETPAAQIIHKNYTKKDKNSGRLVEVRMNNSDWGSFRKLTDVETVD